MARLDHRAAEDHRPADQSHGAWRQGIGRFPCGDSVDAGLRVFGQADHDRLGPRPHRTCLGRADEAPWVHAICGARRRLGRDCHRPDGRAGASGIDRHSHQHAWRGSARHRQGGSSPARRRRPASRPTRKRAYERLAFFYARTSPTRIEMGTRPQTLYGIADSPVGLAAWMLDHDARSLRAHRTRLRRRAEGLTRDDVLDNITLFWLTNTAISSARLYWENKLPFFDAEGRLHPGCRERLSRRALSRRRGAGRSRPIPSSSTTTSSTRAGTSRRGNSRSSSRKRFARASDRCAHSAGKDVLMPSDGRLNKTTDSLWRVMFNNPQ